MSDFAFVLDPLYETHDTGPGHPERPERVAAVRRAVEAVPEWRDAPRIDPTPVSREALERVHDSAHLERIEEAAKTAPVVIDGGDTVLGVGSLDVAKRAAGSIAELAARIWDGTYRAGFAAVRPPGHHAERNRAMGFCLYDNVAVAAAELRARGADRVLIVDWDVHHGNGTQDIFERDPSVLFASVHQSPLYPGTGARSETGIGAGEGFTRNFPLLPGSGDAEFLDALGPQLAPFVDDFKPQFVLISAGFDAHVRDPLANLEVTTPAFRQAATILRGYADKHAEGRILSVLEGGYDLTALAEGTVAHLESLVPAKAPAAS